MTPAVPTVATSSLLDAAGGNDWAAERLMPLVYDRLRALAAKYLKDERPNHTLQPTALVHEAYIGLVDIRRVDWNGKTHFFAMAARQMRRVLVNQAKAKQAKKRGERLNESRSMRGLRSCPVRRSSCWQSIKCSRVSRASTPGRAKLPNSGSLPE